MRAHRWFLLVALALVLTVPCFAANEPPRISTPKDGSLGIDPSDKLILGWTTDNNAGIKTYRVQLSRDPNFGELLDLKDADVAMDPKRFDIGQEYEVAFVDESHKLAPGTVYYWRVIALTESGEELPSPRAHFVTVKDPFARLAEHGFFLTRAEEGVDKEKPATFSFIRKGDDEGEEQYLAEFLLGWNGPAFAKTNRTSWSMQAAVAGKLTNASKEEKVDTLAKSSLGVVHDWSFGEKRTSSLYQRLSLAYEGDQGYDTRKAIAEYLVTFSNAYVGRFRGKSGGIERFFRPYLGVVVGRTVEAGDSAEVEDQIFRIVPSADVTLRLNPIARRMGIADVQLTLSDKFYFLPNEEREQFNYFSASLNFEVAKGFTTGVVFKNGYDAPKFEGTNTTALTFGFKFGDGE